MLMLALTAHRTGALHPDMARFAMQGDILRAVQFGRAGLQRSGLPGGARLAACTGQLLGRCLLAAGLEEEADELFRSQMRHYQDMSRAHVRWLGGLDQGCLMLQMNRPGRAAEAFTSVADDTLAEVGLRIEAMAGAAVALHRAADCRRAWQSLEMARRLASAPGLETTLRLVDALGLELLALQSVRTLDAIADHALSAVYQEGQGAPAVAQTLEQRLRDTAAAFAPDAPLVAQRLLHVARMASRQTTAVVAAAQATEALAWLRQHGFSGLEPALRIESALMMLAHGAVNGAADLLGPETRDDRQLRRSRHPVDLHYCLSRLNQCQGRASEALRWYRMHTQEAVIALRRQATGRVSDSYMVAVPQRGEAVEDAERARLPLRYRRAHQYIVEHLHDEHLSVQSVAAQLGVTERALQMAFRAHLGMTPAELIRTRRAEGVRNDLCAHAGEHRLEELAQRWGLRNRSTLSNVYRSRFAETPTQTLNGGALSS